MKKKVIGFAVFGTLITIVGAVGAGTNFSKAKAQTKTTINDSYTIKKNKQKLDLTLSGDIHYHFYESEDDAIHISGQAHSFTKDVAFDWQASEAKDQTALNIAYNESKNDQQFPFDFFTSHSQYVNIAIPRSFETITINNGKSSTLTLNSIKTTDLVLNTDKYAYASLEDLRISNLTVNSPMGNINLENVTAEKKITLTGETAHFSILESQAEAFDIQNVDGYVELSELIGTTSVQSESGYISLDHLTGKSQVVTLDGKIDWESSKLTDDLDFKTTSGDIRIALERQPNNFEVTAKTTNGLVKLFGKEQQSFKRGTDGPTLTLESLHGDIRVFDDNTDYEDDEFDTELNFDDAFYQFENEVMNRVHQADF